MRGHIHKRVRKTQRGKETTLWYVVLDVGITADGRLDRGSKCLRVGLLTATSLLERKVT